MIMTRVIRVPYVTKTGTVYMLGVPDSTIKYKIISNDKLL